MLAFPIALPPRMVRPMGVPLVFLIRKISELAAPSRDTDDGDQLVLLQEPC